MYHLFTSHVCGLRLALSMNLFTYIKIFFGVLFFEKQFYSYIFSNTFDIKNSMKRYSIPFLENMFLRTVLKTIQIRPILALLFCFQITEF